MRGYIRRAYRPRDRAGGLVLEGAAPDAELPDGYWR